MATKTLGIPKFDVEDRAHDPRFKAGQVDSATSHEQKLDDAILAIDNYLGSGSAADLYTPVSASHWNGAAPTTVKQALDRIAQWVFLGHSGSIL
jgi:hypothetical protein